MDMDVILISDLFLMFYTTFTFAAAVLNQLAKSRLTATFLKKDSFYISYHKYEILF